MLLMSAVFPHMLGAPLTGIIDNGLREWKGFPVNLTIDSSDAVLAVEGSFSIKKNEATRAIDKETLTIAASDSVGFLNGVYFILRAQQQRDTCLCITLPHYDAMKILPVFDHRVAVYDCCYIRGLETSCSLVDKVRSDAMCGINGWIIEAEDFPSGPAYDTDDLQKILSEYGIQLHKDRQSLGKATLELSDGENRKFMGDIWQEQIREAYGNGYRTILYHPQIPDQRHPFREINLYAFGRLSSDVAAIPKRIAYEWLASTYSDNPLIVRPLMESMLNSDETSFCTKLKEIKTY